MSSNQDDKTKKFIEEAKNIVDQGIEPTYKAIADKIGWHNNSLSMALKGKRNIPFEIYKKFTEIYKQPPQQTTEAKSEDFQAKYMALLEEHLEMKKAFFQELEGFKKMMLDFKKSHDYLKTQFTEVVKALKQVEQNQLSMYAFQGAYYDYWLSAVENSEEIRQIIGGKAREAFVRLQQEGIHLSSDIEHS